MGLLVVQIRCSRFLGKSALQIHIVSTPQSDLSLSPFIVTDHHENHDGQGKESQIDLYYRQPLIKYTAILMVS